MQIVPLCFHNQYDKIKLIYTLCWSTLSTIFTSQFIYTLCWSPLLSYLLMAGHLCDTGLHALDDKHKETAKINGDPIE